MRGSINNLLLLDDDPDDCFLFRKALSDVTDKIALRCIEDCDDLIPSLKLRTPDLLFMDINMPKRNGFVCMEELKAHPLYKRLSIVIYSSSDNAMDITRAYGYGASLFLKKPTTYSGLVRSLTEILEMDWKRPESISANYFVEGRFLPFQTH